MNVLSGMGITGSSLSYLNKQNIKSVSGNPRKNVPVLEKIRHKKPPHEIELSDSEGPPEKEADYYTIPRTRWEYIKTTFAASQRIYNKLYKEFGRRCRNIEVSVGTTVNNQSEEL